MLLLKNNPSFEVDSIQIVNPTYSALMLKKEVVKNWSMSLWYLNYLLLVLFFITIPSI